MRKFIIAVLLVLIMTTQAAAGMPEQLINMQNMSALPLIYSAARSIQIGDRLSVRARSLKEQIAQAPESHPLIGCDCTFTAEELNLMFIKGQVGYGDVYARMQEETGLCPIWSAAIDAAESGHFTSFSAPGNVSGFGYNGRSYMSFTSIEACVTHKSRFLAAEYLTPGGRYYHGTSLSAVCKSYNGSNYWINLVTEVAYCMLQRAERAAEAL